MFISYGHVDGAEQAIPLVAPASTDRTTKKVKLDPSSGDPTETEFEMTRGFISGAIERVDGGRGGKD